MLFWTIVCIFMGLLYLVKGDILEKNKIKLLISEKELQLMKENKFGFSKEKKEKLESETTKIGLQVVFIWFPYIIGILIYCIVALKVDVYKYPSIAMLLWNVLLILLGKAKTRKVDIDTEEDIERLKAEVQYKKYRSIKGVLLTLIRLVYFSYMFYILVFL